MPRCALITRCARGAITRHRTSDAARARPAQTFIRWVSSHRNAFAGSIVAKTFERCRACLANSRTGLIATDAVCAKSRKAIRSFCAGRTSNPGAFAASITRATDAFIFRIEVGGDILTNAIRAKPFFRGGARRTCTCARTIATYPINTSARTAFGIRYAYCAQILTASGNAALVVFRDGNRIFTIHRRSPTPTRSPTGRADIHVAGPIAIDDQSAPALFIGPARMRQIHMKQGRSILIKTNSERVSRGRTIPQVDRARSFDDATFVTREKQ